MNSFNTKTAGVTLAFVLLFGAWAREAFNRTEAERFAAERDVAAQVAIDSAAVYQGQRDAALELAEAAEAAWADSTVVWAQRLAQANQRAQRAVLAAETAAEQVLATADSATAAAFNDYVAARDEQVAAALEQGRDEGRRAAEAVLRPQITALEGALRAAEGEIGQLRVALDEVTEARDALGREVRHQKRVGWLWKGAALGGLVCAAACR